MRRTGEESRSCAESPVLRSCLITEEISRENVQGLTLLDPFKTTATYVAPLKREGVDDIIALTHLEYAEDRRLAELFPDMDVIICGREHSPIATTIARDD